MSTITQLMDKREKEVTEQIGHLRKQLAPLEAELAQIRVAKAAMKVDEPTQSTQPAELTIKSVPFLDVFGLPPMLGAYQHLTMKQLTVKALKEQFRNGATANQLIAFFKNAWGRTDVVRSSLSPQLSRLQEDGYIKREGRVWHLMKDPNE